MPSYRINRLASDIKFELAEIFRSLKDPRVTAYMLTISRVEVSNDLSCAKVYVGAMEGIQAAKSAVKGLESASGFIKREISSRIKMRKVPEFRFIADDSIEHSAHIARMLDSFKSEDTRNND